mgnify:CR=1 FL=1
MTLAMKKFGESYMGFAVGVIFGAIVATLTSYSIFAIAGGDLEQAELLQIRDCLIERINE